MERGEVASEGRDPAPIAAGLLPARKIPADDAAWTALGIALGPEQAIGDRDFRPATLPGGWVHRYADDWWGGYLVDERGINRVEVLCATRDADMRILDVGEHYAVQAIYGTGELAGPWDRLTGSERARAAAFTREYVESVKGGRGYADLLPRAEALLAKLTLPAGG